MQVHLAMWHRSLGDAADCVGVEITARNRVANVCIGNAMAGNLASCDSKLDDQAE